MARTIDSAYEIFVRFTDGHTDTFRPPLEPTPVGSFFECIGWLKATAEDGEHGAIEFVDFCQLKTAM